MNKCEICINNQYGMYYTCNNKCEDYSHFEIDIPIAIEKIENLQNMNKDLRKANTKLNKLIDSITSAIEDYI